jgi:hypothetical protein
MFLLNIIIPIVAFCSMMLLLLVLNVVVPLATLKMKIQDNKIYNN